jgi:hypothetical protein
MGGLINERMIMHKEIKNRYVAPSAEIMEVELEDLVALSIVDDLAESDKEVLTKEENWFEFRDEW